MRTTSILLPVVGLGIAFLLRYWGFEQGYPELYGHIDEVGVAASVWNFYRSATLMPTEFTYPAFFSYLNAAGLLIAYWAGLLTDVGGARESIVFASFVDPALSALTGRLISVVTATVTVMITFLLARRCADTKTAWVSLVFLTASAVPVNQAHQALPDSTMAMFGVLTFYFSWRIFESGQLRHYLMGGLAAGLLVATKYNGGFVALALVSAYVLRQRRAGHSIIERKALQKIALCIAVSLLALFLASPHLILAHEKYLALGRYQVSSLSFTMSEGTPWWWVIVGFVKAEFLLGALFLAGFVAAVRRRGPMDWILLAAWIPSFFYIGSWTRESLHYLLQFYPVLCIQAAALVSGSLEHSRRLTPLIIPLAIVCITPNLITVVQQNRDRNRLDTRQLAADWIVKNVSNGSAIAMTWLPYSPRVQLQDGQRRIRDYYAGNTRVLRMLEKEWGGQPSYHIVNMEVWLKKPRVPPALEKEVDIEDPETLRVFRRVWLSPAQLKARGVKYIVLPEAIYQRYMQDAEVPPRGAARFHYLKNRVYFERLTSAANQEVILECTIQPTPLTRGGGIRIYRII